MTFLMGQKPFWVAWRVLIGMEARGRSGWITVHAKTLSLKESAASCGH